MARLPDHEMRLIAVFFGPRHGYFVKVGANDPRERSHTWHLEQAGWSGVLIEPRPELAGLLRANRTAKVYAVACLDEWIEAVATDQAQRHARGHDAPGGQFVRKYTL